MGKAAEYFLGEQPQAEHEEQVEMVKDDLTQHRGDPLSGQAPEVVNDAVREAQEEPRTTPVATQATEEKDGIVAGAGHVDIEKQDIASRVGPETAEQQHDANKAVEQLDEQDRAELNEITANLREHGYGQDTIEATHDDLWQTTRDPDKEVGSLDADTLRGAQEVGQSLQQSGVEQEADATTGRAAEMFAAPEAEQEAQEPQLEPEYEPE